MKNALLISVLCIVGIAVALDTSPYFPIEIGHEWVYQDSTDAGYDTLTDVTTGTTTMGGYPTFVVVEIGGEVMDTHFYQIRTDGLYNMFSMEIELAGVSIDNYPVLILKNPASVGDEWLAVDIDTTVSVMGTDVDVEIQIMAEFNGFEDVTTPLDDFRDCIKVTATAIWKVDAGVMFSDSGVDVYSVMYFAEGVGLVRTTEYDVVGAIMGTPTPPVTSLLIDYDFTGIADAAPLPSNAEIRVFPNPFNSDVEIVLPEEGVSSVEIYDVGGRMVGRIEDVSISGVCKWSPSEKTESGVYLVRATISNGVVSTRAIYIK